MTSEGAELISAHGPRALKTAITQTYTRSFRAGAAASAAAPEHVRPNPIKPSAARSAERCRMEVIELADAVAGELHGGQ